MQGGVNLCRSMPPMVDIDSPHHLWPSAHQQHPGAHPNVDPVSEQCDEGTDDDRTLADLKRKRAADTSRGEQALPVVDPSLVLQRSPGWPRGNGSSLPHRMMMMTTVAQVWVFPKSTSVVVALAFSLFEYPLFFFCPLVLLVKTRSVRS